MSGVSLREQVGAPPDPGFDMDLPPGWQRHAVDKQAMQAMLTATKKRCMDEHRPQLYAELKAMLERSFDEMHRAGVIAYFCPTDPGADTLAIPASINATIRAAEPGQTLDHLVRLMIQHHGGKPLLGDKRTVRVERERTMSSGEETVINHSVVYLTPVPGSKRRRALQLVAAFPRTPDMPPDAPELDAMRAVFDSCVSTLRWRRTEPNQT